MFQSESLGSTAVTLTVKLLVPEQSNIDLFEFVSLVNQIQTLLLVVSAYCGNDKDTLLSFGVAFFMLNHILVLSCFQTLESLTVRST
jgi:hypothetical protein